LSSALEGTSRKKDTQRLPVSKEKDPRDFTPETVEGGKQKNREGGKKGLRKCQKKGQIERELKSRSPTVNIFNRDKKRKEK